MLRCRLGLNPIRGTGPAVLPQAGSAGGADLSSCWSLRKARAVVQVLGLGWGAEMLLLLLPTSPHEALGASSGTGCSPHGGDCGALVSSSPGLKPGPFPRATCPPKYLQTPVQCQPSKPQCPGERGDHTCGRKRLRLRRRTFVSSSWALVAQELPPFMCFERQR